MWWTWSDSADAMLSRREDNESELGGYLRMRWAVDQVCIIYHHPPAPLEICYIIPYSIISLQCITLHHIFSCHVTIKFHRWSPLLIRNGANIEAVARSGKKAVDYLENETLREEFRRVVESAWHDTSLHRAVYGKDADAVRTILHRSGDPNLLGTGGRTPLHHASMCGNTAMANLLLEAGARILCDSSGITPLHIACKRGNIELCKALMQIA